MNKAIILAAGLGSRLGDLTKSIPKCLLPIAGQPMLQVVIERLLTVGVQEIVINTFHLADQVEQFIGKLSYPNVQIKVSRESSLLGTGGGIKQAYRFFSVPGDFFVHNADVVSNVDLQLMISAHESSQALANIACMKLAPPRHLIFNQSDELIAWANSTTGSQRFAVPATGPTQPGHYLCIQTLSSKIMEYFDLFDGEFSLFDPFLKAVEDGKQIKAVWFHDIMWHDIGTPETLLAAQQIREGIKYEPS